MERTSSTAGRWALALSAAVLIVTAPADLAAEFIADATRIRAVLACG